MNEALELIQRKLEEYKAKYDSANERVREHRDLAELAAQERDVYNEAIDELNKALKVLARVQQEEVSEKVRKERGSERA